MRTPDLCVHMHGKKSVEILSDNNMNVIKLRYDSASSIVIIIFRCDNVNMIISHMPLFMNLLWILPVSWHHGWNVEKNLG